MRTRMTQRNRITNWPLLCLFACLFAARNASAPASQPEGPQLVGPTTLVGQSAPHDEVCPVPENGAPEGPRLLPQAAHDPIPRVAHTPARTDAKPDGTGSLSAQLPPLVTPNPAVAPAWVEPKILLEQLAALAAQPPTAAWAATTAQSIRQLGPAVVNRSPSAATILQTLRASAAQANTLPATLADRGLARELSRAGYALRRRLDVWQALVAQGSGGSAILQAPLADPRRLAVCLAQFDRVTADSAMGEAWREYLLIDAIRPWATENRPPAGQTPTATAPRVIAQRVLHRLDEVPMSSQQRQFIASPALLALRDELKRWAAEPVGLGELLAHVEQYENTGLASDARLLAADCANLRLAADPSAVALADRLEAYYRNANLRVAVTEELLDRLMPAKEPERAAVRETILGHPVSGESLTSAQLGVRLLPDPNRVRLALEVTGTVASLTSSTAGPATFHNDSTAAYVAQKPLEVDLRGIRILPTQVAVDNETRIRKLETDFDGVPLLGNLVRQIARSQHDQKRDEMSTEVRERVASEARERIDKEVTAQLTEVCHNVQEHVLGPLQTSRLDPTLVSALTTDKRLTMRLRLAGEDQLGSHTPRPQAPADSLVSFQIHETVLNNLLERLNLEGRTFTLAELADHVTDRLGRPDLIDAPPDQADVSITFAEHDAVALGFEDGQVMVQLSIDSLSKASRTWRNFTVSVFYQSEVEGRTVRLARDGIIHLSGQKRATGSQIILRGIFAKTFSQRRSWQLTPERLADDPQFDDLEVTQFEITDGWLGMAMGPARTATRTTLLPRKANSVE